MFLVTTLPPLPSRRPGPSHYGHVCRGGVCGVACKPALAAGTQYSLRLLPPRLPPRHCGDRSSMEPRLPVLSRDEGAETFSGRSGDSGTAGRGVGCGLQPLSAGLCTRRPPRAGACNLQGRSSASPGLEGSAPDPGRPGKAARLRRQRRCAHHLVTQREQECGGPHPHGVQAARPLTLSLHSAD